jgi:hypothetical protein
MLLEAQKAAKKCKADFVLQHWIIKYMLKNQPNGKFGYGFKQIRKGPVREDSSLGDFYSHICPSNYARKKSPPASNRNSS